MVFTLLGIETSCDETAVAVLRGLPGAVPEVLAEVTLSQIADHQPYGGVVPEVAARAHLAHLDGLIREVLRRSGLTLGDLDGIAATAGPGLIGGVLVGLTTAKALAMALQKPLIAVNHLEGHALSVRLVENIPAPFPLLLVSGGHCQILVVEDLGQYRRLGTTIDDAVGEAFDKAAKLLGLAYPGGPAIEAAAVTGDPTRFDLPRPLLGRPGFDFSFSGLKTALRQIVETAGPLDARMIQDLAAGFQAAIADCLADRVGRALATLPKGGVLVVAGGVAANKALRQRLTLIGETYDRRLVAPPAKWCTDNAAMIAWAGIERLARGLSDGLDIPARARWPLDADAQRPAANKALARRALA